MLIIYNDYILILNMDILLAHLIYKWKNGKMSNFKNSIVFKTKFYNIEFWKSNVLKYNLLKIYNIRIDEYSLDINI